MEHNWESRKNEACTDNSGCWGRDDWARWQALAPILSYGAGTAKAAQERELPRMLCEGRRERNGKCGQSNKISKGSLEKRRQLPRRKKLDIFPWFFYLLTECKSVESLSFPMLRVNSKFNLNCRPAERVLADKEFGKLGLFSSHFCVIFLLLNTYVQCTTWSVFR